MTEAWGQSLVQPAKPTQSKPVRSAPRKSLVPLQVKPSLPADTHLWGAQGDRRSVLAAINQSLRYLGTSRATEDYRRYATPGISRDRVVRSLKRFRQLLTTARSATELQAAVEREFTFYQATGKDGQGTVAFTGYFEPIHTASRVPTKDFRYPIFRLPADFPTWKQPHPTRSQLEGNDGLQFARGPLKGVELAWLRDRLEAFLIQVQGSAQLRLTTGGTMTIGFAGHTDYPYVGIGRELVKAGKFRLEELTLPAVVQYFQQNPAELDAYLPRNRRFVFFQETGGAPAMGSLGVPVTAGRSIATDKTLFPPGALAMIQTRLPYPTASGSLEQQAIAQYVLDQDTGGAIKGAGRVDIFMGTGELAGDRAGLINSPGQLYYLLLKQ